MRKPSKGFWIALIMGLTFFLSMLLQLNITYLNIIYPPPRAMTKWDEGKAIAATIATYIEVYVAEHSAVPADNDFEALGFIEGDLDGTYFNQSMLSFSVISLEPLKYTVTVTNLKLDPQRVIFSYDGDRSQWTEIKTVDAEQAGPEH